MLNKNKKRKVYFIQFLKSYVCFLRASNLNINLYVKHSVLDNGVICLSLSVSARMEATVEEYIVSSGTLKTVYCTAAQMIQTL